MKPTITLVLGGARSGKSTAAERLAHERWRRPLYLATAERTDAEMAERIAVHRARRGPHWSCVEEPLDLARALLSGAPDSDGVLVECLTTWVANVLVREGEAALSLRRDALFAALAATPRPVILVSNEVGLGIVPEHPLGRQFRDLAGWLNQDMARLAHEVTFLVAGLPLWLKILDPSPPQGHTTSRNMDESQGGCQPATHM
ncbi:MAG: bifunctional adenosylcobinamide kinase/adenosylcobinamide-phosphate guanylyltransferase [bacterium]